MAKTVYLDHNASTPMLASVAEVMSATCAEAWANPSSQHGPGRRARSRLEASQRRVSELLGARTTGLDPDRLVLTSGGTEANMLAMRGLAGPPPAKIAISAIEHPSIGQTADQMQREGYEVDQIGVTPSGVVRVDAIRALLEGPHPPRLVSVLYASNVTGVVQPIQQIASLCHEHGVLFHTDAAQGVGKVAIDFDTLGVDAMSFAAHKFHGPVGIGGLLVRSGVPLVPALLGGHQQGGLRSGTESVLLAAGLAAALEAWHAESTERESRMRLLRDRLEQGLAKVWPGLEVLGSDTARLPHTSCVAFPGLDRQVLLMALDLAGVACSAGSACASGSSEPSPTLMAMALDPRVVGGALRMSLGATTTPEEIDLAVERVASVCAGFPAG